MPDKMLSNLFIPMNVLCDDCNGTGIDQSFKYGSYNCRDCRGTGFIKREINLVWLLKEIAAGLKFTKEK